MPATQRNRPIQVSTPLGDDVLLFYRMEGTERLGELFEYRLELLSEDRAIDPDELLGKNVTVGLALADGGWRYFNGYVARFGQGEDLAGFAFYRAVLRSWMWFLTRATNCRIFQKKSVPEIVKEVFRDHGFDDFDDHLSGTYATRDYCVQYRETDFAFVSRLLEEEGIYYSFAHENGKHRLVLSDAIASHAAYPGYQTILYRPGQHALAPNDIDRIRTWGYAREVRPGRCALTDYDFKKPNANLHVKSILKRPHANADFERFDYPGRYTSADVGDGLVRTRMEEHHARHERWEGTGDARGLAPGYLFHLAEHPGERNNGEYLAVAAQYRLRLDAYTTRGASSDAEELFQCEFEAIAAAHRYRPPHVTPKAMVYGAQTAVVVGPPGAEIHTDSYGRVKVQFHWDRYGKRNEKSSCWIRVSQPWAGKGWGTVAIPRIGQEVIVEFLEGDPDRPIITGRVYNAMQKPPYALPGGAHMMGFKSNSTPGGAGYSEMVIHDTAGQERIVLHSQKDMDTTVRNNDTQHIMANRTVAVDGAHNETVKKDMTVTVLEGNQVTVVQTGEVKILAKTKIKLNVGASTLTMDAEGNITLEGVMVKIVGSGQIDLNPDK